jgi:hypothetical protein
MTLVPILERLFLRDLIGRAEREGRKAEEVGEKVQLKRGFSWPESPDDHSITNF